jgi:hypothetical protein
MDVHFAKPGCKICNQVVGGQMRWSYRFGVRPGLDLVVALVVLCVLFMALEPRTEAGVGTGDGEAVAFGSGVDIAVAAGQKNKIRIVHPTKGAHISGKTHIKLKVGQNIKRVFVFIDDKYFAPGPPYTIFWNSATVSNGPHRITVAAATTALSSDALFLVSQSQTTTKFFVQNKVSPTPSATSTPDPPAWPSGVPTPVAIPTLTPPRSPVTVSPGTNGVVGNAVQNTSTGAVTGTDDTTAFQNLINLHDIIVTAGGYNIAGSISIPSNRVIQCQPGATFYGSTSTVFQMGWFGGSPSNISIGPNCTFAGTSVPTGTGTNYLPAGGTGTLMAIAGNGNGAANYINVQGNTFKNSWMDELLIYDNCGAGNPTSGNCGGKTPGSDGEGPNHIYIANNSFSHCSGAPGIHINGGQYIYVYNNMTTDCNINQEEDPGVNQIIKGLYIYQNKLTTSSFGQASPPTTSRGGGFLSCVGNAGITLDNGSGCWAVGNTLNGCASQGTNPCVQLQMSAPNYPYAGNSTGNYYGNILQNGAVLNGTCYNGCLPTGAANQLTVPYCDGVTCDTTGWLNTPPTPN